jgi:hypothetical protein
MSDPFADSTERLRQLLAEIMKQKCPEKCDELAAEIWRVLVERDSLENRLNDSEIAQSEMERRPDSMSTIQEVRSAEKRVQDLLCRIKRDPMGESRYVDEFKRATDEYARAVRDLKPEATR